MTEVYKEKTTLDGVPLEIVGISQDTPIYPMADVKLYSRIILNNNKTGRRTAEVCLKENFNKKRLMKWLKLLYPIKKEL